MSGISRYGSIAILILTFQLIILTDIKSQKVELSPYLGYTTAARFPRDHGYFRIGGGFDYGVSLNYSIKHAWGIEISYSYLNSDISAESGRGINKYCDLKSQYLSLGALKEISPGKSICPYGLLELGWVNYHPSSNGFSNENLLQCALAGGIKMAVSDNFGLRFQARILMPVWFAGDYFSGYYIEKLLTISTAKVIFQGDFTVAAIMILNKKHERLDL